jgi:hypothetical protein
MSCARQDFTIAKGKTFSRVLRWETEPFVYKAISAITKAAPAVVTATAHGVPDGWRVAIVSVLGMTEINALNDPPLESDFRKAKVLTGDTIELNAVNSAGFTVYAAVSGFVQYYTPVDLAGFSARMQIRQSLTATTFLLELTTVNGRIALDNALKTITLTVSAVDTAALTWKTGVYDLELVSPGGVVTQLLSGTVMVTEEATK